MNNTISDDDQEKLMVFLESCSDRELHEIVDSFLGSTPHHEPDWALFDQRAKRVFARIEHVIDSGEQQQITFDENVKRRSWMTFVRTAAAVFLFGLTAYYYFSTREHEAMDAVAMTDIPPGYNQAKLVLADGTQIDLDSSKAGIIFNEKAINYDDGSIVEFADGASDAPLSPSDTYTLTTPPGGQYQIVLSDGTKVWLNAATTLKYPSKFGVHSREVEVEGEAYFDVTESEGERKWPFIVKSHGQRIIVLGTSFNVNAYAEDMRVKTTLVEGVVKIQSDISSRRRDRQVTELVLKPGEQSVLSYDSASLYKKTANLSAEIAWREGRFNFENKSFRQVMTELGRWYDIDIVYEGTIPQVEFFGDAVRNANLSTILRLLESTKVAYRIDGKRLIIADKTKT
ncbi:FecR family protein [Parapedobacter sp. 10938]|uniref:FecR family protein n=1 Tax=Parapedobacter flavus TaxID=3110225 RepID=UPI002DB6E3EA|nr:FecR domain-containing protein [Parapedobacter sp. 10938]MEC3879530.1 FecR domain-containing protein [Parapedobacter sp. 10938]